MVLVAPPFWLATATTWLGSIGVALLFAAFGWFARRPSVIAFGVGATLFAIDTLIFLLASDWIGVAFHAFALFYILPGLGATRAFKARCATVATA